jgi:beta-N-acetylhexosaminidase
LRSFAALLLLFVSTVHADERWVERTLRSMSVDEKIGQLVMARSEPIRDAWRAIEEYHVGSIHGGIGDAAAVAVTLNELQRMSKLPLLTSANLEGGAGYVLYGATRMPLAMAIAATGDERLAYEAARVTAQEGRAAGINVNFYPVADVNNNPANPIINIRSFGEDPATVSRFVAAYVRGIQEHGQLATAKHFPGHGDVAVDSHLQMPTLDVSRERLDAVELPPFRAAIEAGAGAFMTAHIWLPRLESKEGLPATLSKPVLTTLLRDDLGFEGVLFSDSMGMRGVTSSFSVADAAVLAIEAGADILVTPPDVEAAYRALQEAVRSGRISTARLDQSVRRILRAKSALGLVKNRTVDVVRLVETIGTPENRAVAQRIADNAITLVRDQRNVLPLRPSPDLRVVQINMLDTRTGWREGPVGRILSAELAKRFPRAVTIQIDDLTTPAEYELVRKLAGLADALVVNGFVRVASYKGSINLNEAQTRLLRDLSASKKPLVFTAFGSPYVLMHVPELPSYAVTYDIGTASELAAIKALTGEIPYSGKLPINLQ